MISPRTGASAMDSIHHDRSRALFCRALFSDERGSVFAEYAVVFVCATLLVALTVASVGLPLANLYVYAETLIGLPIP
jgi:hypothetical protein